MPVSYRQQMVESWWFINVLNIIFFLIRNHHTVFFIFKNKQLQSLYFTFTSWTTLNRGLVINIHYRYILALNISFLLWSFSIFLLQSFCRGRRVIKFRGVTQLFDKLSTLIFYRAPTKSTLFSSRYFFFVFPHYITY